MKFCVRKQRFSGAQVLKNNKEQIILCPTLGPISSIQSTTER
jgi:hypothetical protein